MCNGQWNCFVLQLKEMVLIVLLNIKIYIAFTITSYHCEEVLILYNKPHPLPVIVPNDTKVGRCNGCFSWQQLKVVLKFHPVCQVCGGNTRNLH